MASQTAAASDSESLLDVKQLTMGAAIASLGYVFWCVGAMEMIERLAYYGVRAVAGIYAKDPVSKGGLGITPSRLGDIFLVWAIAQNFVSALTGGLSDRYGYKQTIAASTAVKISGYLVMAAFPSYLGFMAGATLLATGTAIFKPGIQGTLVKTTNRQNSSVAWGIFYQTVNVGGFIGPLLAGYLRKLAWRNVFIACAAVICLNFVMLLLYKEPGKDERLERERQRKAGNVPRSSLAADSWRELKKPKVFTYLLIFTGFWFMFFGIFDLLPLHVDDWVYTRPVVEALFGADGTRNSLAKFLLILNADGTEMQPEGVLNLNALLIMTTCFAVAAASGRMRATTSIVVGCVLASTTYFVVGTTLAGVLVAGAVLVFSVGEMLSSPKFSEFIGNFAPADKKAMYLGFSMLPVGVGMMLEGKIGPVLYDHFSSKERFARELLLEKGMAADVVAKIPQGEGFGRLVELLHLDKWEVSSMLAAHHHVGTAWYLMACVGLASALGMFLYGRWIRRSPPSDSGSSLPISVTLAGLKRPPIIAAGIASFLAAAACTTHPDDTIDTVFDVCQPLVVVPDGDTTEAELASLDVAIGLWNDLVGAELTRDGASDGAHVPLHFDLAASAFRGLYDDETGQIFVNRTVDDPEGRAITIAHELGHAFGLFHVPPDTRASVMNPGNLTVVPNAGDHDAIVALWGDCP